MKKKIKMLVGLLPLTAFCFAQDTTRTTLNYDPERLKIIPDKVFEFGVPLFFIFLLLNTIVTILKNRAEHQLKLKIIEKDVPEETLIKIFKESNAIAKLQPLKWFLFTFAIAIALFSNSSLQEISYRSIGIFRQWAYSCCLFPQPFSSTTTYFQRKCDQPSSYLNTQIYEDKLTGILVLILIAFSSYGQQDPGITKQEKQAIIDKAIVLLKENYVFPNRVENIEKQIKERLTAGAYDSLANVETFLASLNADLEHYGNDHHLDISYGPKRVKQIIADTKNEQEGKEQKITDEWLQQMRYENFRLRKLERLDGNIGYFNFLNFTPLGVSKQSISSAMNFLLYSNAIIIDLRENGGGSAETMNFLLSYFLEDSIQISELRYRKNNNVIKSYTMNDRA
jgi:hypothetical protein